MRNKRRYSLSLVFFLAFLFSTATGNAQDDTPVVDTIISTVTATPDTGSSFDRIEDKTVPVETRTIPDSVVNKLRQDDEYWYVNTIPERQKIKPNSKPQTESIFEKSWFSNLVWFLVVGCFVTILIWFLASSNIQLFRKRAARIEGETEELSVADIFSLDYETEIHKAIADQNYRMAVRLWYLRILKEMADGNLIQYKHERTNRDYLNQLQDGEYYKDFFRLTREFEYTWYGKFELDEAAFVLIQRDFSFFKQRLPQ